MFEKQRLYDANISEYVGQQCGKPMLVPGVQSLLQDDYGEANDCTLTSITCVIKWMRPSLNVYDIYNQVEETARRYGYKGNRGTPNLVIKSVYQNILNAFGANKKAHSRYFKDIGYGFEYIKKEINEFQPVLLNLWKDGRDYYNSHSILIVGYLEVNDKKLLAVYDNWNKGVSYVDYDKLSTISSIVFLENI